MKMALMIAHCLFLAGCATYIAPQEEAAVLVTRDSMRTYRPLPRQERRVTECTMNVETKVATCR